MHLLNEIFSTLLFIVCLVFGEVLSTINSNTVTATTFASNGSPSAQNVPTLWNAQTSSPAASSPAASNSTPGSLAASSPGASITGLSVAAPGHEFLEQAINQGKGISLTGNPSEYIPTGTAIPQFSATGLDFIIETNAAGAGFVYVTPELKDQIDNALEQNCQNGETSQCKEAVNAILMHPNVALEARNPVIWGLAAVVAAISIWIQVHLDNQPTPQVVSFSPDIVSQMHSEATAGSGAFVENGQTLSIPPDPTTLTGPQETWATLTTPSGTHSSGDVVLTLPTGLASEIQAIIDGSQSQCSSSKLKNKRTVSVDCAISAAENMITNRGARDLLLLTPDRFAGLVPRAQDLMRAANQVGVFATAMSRTLRMSPETAAMFGFVCFSISLAVLLGGQLLTEPIFFPTSEFDFNPALVMSVIQGNYPTLSAAPIASVSITSATGSCGRGLVCQSTYCSGDTTKSTCQITGSNSNCPCTNAQSRTSPDPFDTTLANLQFSFWPSIYSSIAKTPVTPSCIFQAMPTGFNGKPAGSPTAWCLCTQTADPIKSLSYQIAGPLPTLKSTSGSSACQYTSLPTSTISVTWFGGTASPTTCRQFSTTLTQWASGTGLIPTSIATKYCTCNNNQQYLVGTTTLYSGRCTTTFCPDLVPTSVGDQPSLCQGGPSTDPCSPCYVPPKGDNVPSSASPNIFFTRPTRPAISFIPKFTQK